MTEVKPSVVARLRREAKRQQYSLTKNRYAAHEPHLLQGFYALVDLTGQRPDPHRGSLTIHQVAEYLGVSL